MPIPRPIPRREGNSRAGISGAPGSVPAGNRIEHPGKDESPPIGNTTKTEGLSTGSAKSTPTFRSHPHPYANCRNSYKARFQRGLVPTAAPPPKFSAQLRPVGRFYLCFPVILRVRPGACGLAEHPRLPSVPPSLFSKSALTSSPWHTQIDSLILYQANYDF